MIGALFGPGPDVPRTVDTFVEHDGSERTTKGVADSSGARSGGAAFDSPLVAGTDASFQIVDYAAAPRKTDRTSFAAQDPTDDFESSRQTRTSLFSPVGSTAQLDQGEDIRIEEERPADENETSHLTPTGVRPEHIEAAALSTVISTREAKRRRETLDPDRASSASTVISTRELNRRREAPDFDPASLTAQNPAVDFENRPQKVLPLSGARGAMGRPDEPEEAREQNVIVQRELETKSPATERTHPASQTPSGGRREERHRAAFSNPTLEVPTDDEVRSANRSPSPAVKPETGSAEWLDSDRPAQPSARLVAAAAGSKDNNSGGHMESFGAVRARQPIVVAPRIARDNATTERYAADQPSVRPAAGPIASRRESNAVSAPKIRVTIGRIDVRAVSPPQPPAQETAPAAPRMSLDDYLKSSNGGRR